MADTCRPVIPVRSYMELPTIRRLTEVFAKQCGLSPLERVVIVSVVADIAHHIVMHRRQGEIVLQRDTDGPRALTVMTVRHGGTELPESEVNLSRVKRLMDDVTIADDGDGGMIITAKRWDRPRPPRVR
jgi:anti-sigma regulatory factor (Ser/Thr protein kinase)